MNPLTNVKNLAKLNEREIQLGIAGQPGKSWHQKYKDSAWIFVGGIPFDLSEGDIICVFSQYGEIVNINMIRDRKTGKSRGFGFLCYEDQRSTVLAVDNFNGIKLLGRTIRVDHVEEYRVPKLHDDIDEETKRIWEEGCAPKPIEAPDESGDELLPLDLDVKKEEMDTKETKKDGKKKKKKDKKHKKEKKRKRRRHSSTDSWSDTDVSKRKKRNVSSERRKKLIIPDRIKQEQFSPDRKVRRNERLEKIFPEEIKYSNTTEFMRNEIIQKISPPKEVKYRSTGRNQEFRRQERREDKNRFPGLKRTESKHDDRPSKRDDDVYVPKRYKH